MIASRWIGLATIALAVLCGCASPLGNKSADLSEQDSSMAIRIKGLLIERMEMPATAINVQFEEGRVLLAGFVETTAERERAAEIAREHPRVAEVVNEIVVKE